MSQANDNTAEVRSARLEPDEVYDEGRAVLALTDGDRTVLEAFASGEGRGAVGAPPAGPGGVPSASVVPEPC